MSYDISLDDPNTGDVIELDKKHNIAGGTYALGGTREATLNITYNYSTHFRRVIAEDVGIRRLYGLTGAQSIPILESAIMKLKDDVDNDYWRATEGNARQALIGLLVFAKARPDGVWSGD